MPVRKIRDLQEMEDALWREPGDPQLATAIASVWRFAAQTCPLRFPPGVYRHCTIEDAERLREQWEEANFILVRARLSPGEGEELGAKHPRWRPLEELIRSA